MFSLKRNITPHNIKNVELHSYSETNDDLTTNSHYLTYAIIFKGWENVFLELGSEMFNTSRLRYESNLTWW